jgi:hypothetical protein
MCPKWYLNCRESFGDKIHHLGEEKDIMQLAGASPDAVVVDRETFEPLAVFEVKCKFPFFRQSNGESTVPNACHLSSDV